MNTKKISAVFLIVLLGVLFAVMPASAQKQDPRWFGPFQLSTPGRFTIGPGAIVADQYGYVHAFWAEGGLEEDRYVIQYARFDGTTWSAPVDIFVSPPAATFGQFFEPIVTSSGILHLFMSLSSTGPMFNMSVPVLEALSAQNWVRHRPLDFPVQRVALAESSDGRLLVLATQLVGNNRGVTFFYSEDEGATFSVPVWLDPDIPQGVGASTVELERDESTGILHAVYRYEKILGDGAFLGQGNYYMRSLDDGATWSQPHVLDIADEEPNELRSDALRLAAANGQVHVIWAGVSTTSREHAYSLDSGETWTPGQLVFGNLQGAAGDAFEVDGAGNFHFLGQVRFPQGLYDITWNGSKWSFPSLVYLVRLSPDRAIEDRIHIHNVKLAVLRGNQLVTIFTDAPTEPDRQLYAMHRTLENIPAAELLPTPQPTPTRTPVVTPTAVVPEKTPTPTLMPFSSSEQANVPGPGLDIGISILVSIGVVALVGVVRMVQASRRVRRR